jgi:hypothetical protein
MRAIAAVPVLGRDLPWAWAREARVLRSAWLGIPNHSVPIVMTLIWKSHTSDPTERIYHADWK